MKVSFIGGGNMANAIITGLIAASFNPHDITVSDPSETTRSGLEKTFGLNTTSDNNKTITGPGVILILAVKPQVMETVAKGIATIVQHHRPLIITIAAGIVLSDLSGWLTTETSNVAPALVRCMPNTPALVGEGATGIYASPNVTDTQKNDAYRVLQSISKEIHWVEKESLLDVVTGVSGSGPAYFFIIVEALEKAGVELGLPVNVARALAAQTCLGAGKMLTTSSDSPEILRKKVTSPNGTTQAAVESLERDNISEIIANAVRAATARGEELGRVLGGKL